MTTYFYRARKETGRHVAGSVKARSEIEAAFALKKKGLLIMWVCRCPPILDNIANTLSGGGADKKHLALFCRQLATMLDAGVTLDHALESLTDMSMAGKFKEAIRDVIEQIRKGSSFSMALMGYPRLFPEVMLYMVEAAELGGSLPEVLDDLALYFETENRFDTRLKSVAIYPAFLLITISLLIAGMVSIVIPKYLAAFQQLHITPPLFTMLVVKAGSVVSFCWPFLLGTALFFCAGYKRINNTQKGCSFIMDLPLAGKLIKSVAIARYCGVLGMLLERGVHFLPALEVSGRVSGNVVLKAVGDKLIGGLMAGHNLSRIMVSDNFFPSLVIQMVKVGEETGRLGEAFNKSSQYYRRETEVAVKRLLAAVEPLFILLMGGIIGLLVVALLLPMVNLINIL